jgi:hypothetical protein
MHSFVYAMPYEGGKTIMGDSYFDLITHEVLKQKHRKEQLEDENRQLRQQLADLRTGRGIFVEVEGKRFALTIPTDSLSIPTEQESTAFLNMQSSEASPTSTSFPIVSAQSLIIAPIQEEQQEPVLEQHKSDEAAKVLKRNITQKLPISIADTSHTAPGLTEEETAPTFLEEAMIDEFTSAATSPLAVWSGPPVPHAPKKQEEIDEEEKAALRRQLIGSFLLE